MYLLKAFIIIKYLVLYSINLNLILRVGLNKHHVFLVISFINFDWVGYLVNLDWVGYLAALLATLVCSPTVSFKPVGFQLFVNYLKYLQVNSHL